MGFRVTDVLTHPGNRCPETCQVFIEETPRHALFLAPAIDPLKGESHGSAVVCYQLNYISADPVVPVVADELLS